MKEMREGSTEITANKLSLEQRSSLLRRLANTAEDHEKFLLKLKERFVRVGITLPTVEVRFENLNVEAEAFVGRRSLPSFFNSTANVLQSIADSLHINARKKRYFTVLNDLSGIIKPGRMTLLLGPPGSGKTSLLLALAGKLDSDLKFSGKITYNGEEFKSFNCHRTATYVSEHDVHMRELTVRETLEFSARCQGVGSRYEMLAELLRREKEANLVYDPDDIDIFLKAISTEGKDSIRLITDYIIKILDLDVCADTKIGDEMLRGVSGGQKRRVTTGEMIVGPARVLFMDEISNGLDSSTTFRTITALKQIISIMGGTALISLLQPAPEAYELFDDIVLLSRGQIVYQGPREDVLDFFHSMGFSCPKRKAVADFLQEVISWKDQKQYWAQNDKQYRFVPVSEFAEAFQSFHVGERIKKEIKIPFDKTKSHPLSLATSKYGVKRMELLKTCIVRELLLLKKNSFVYAFRALKMTILAIITMTMFLRTNMPRKSIDDGTIFLGSIFFSIMSIMFNGFSELALTIVALPIFYKQRDSLFYPSWAYAISAWILKIPSSLVEVSLWVFLNYYVIGYDPSISRFIKHYIIIFLVTQLASGLYRSIAVIARTMVLAIATTFYILEVIIVFSGYMLSHDDIRKYLIWGYWISPIMYSQNAASINEFLGNNWNHIIPGTNQTLGVQVLKYHGMLLEKKWYWIGVAVLAGYWLLSNLLFTTSLSCTKPLGRIKTVQAEELMDKKKSNTINDFQATQMEDVGINRELSSMDCLNSTMLNKRNIMTLPFTPISISFDNIRYSVEMPKAMKMKGTSEKLVLLNGLSGCFREGVLTALMGVSGAGKTTLLDVLAGRKTSGYIEGNITISGYPKDQQTFARLSGYCEQYDIHSPYVTVYESLVYSAWLRLSANIDSEKRRMFIEEVMDLVEMMDFKDALVGLPGINGLSIDQRKRLTIAVELVANPSIIFMDEPTSGVDARTSAIVMRVVRKIVNTGRTVVCTIHQPSIDIFETFDELFLMKKGGQEIYVGPLGKNSCNLIAYFEGIHGISKIKDGYNPATWVLEVTSETQENLTGVNFNEIYKSSDLYLKNAAMIAEQSVPHSGSSKIHFSTKYSQTFSVQFVACLWKLFLSYSRNSSYTTLKFFFTILMALTFGIIFWDLGGKKEKQRDLLNAMGSLYVAILFMGVPCSNLVQPIISIERTVFYRERAAGIYSALPYAIGQVVIELPYIFVQAILFCVIVYPMIGFDWTATKFFWYFFFTFFSFLHFTYYGMMTVSTTPNLHIASILLTSFFSLWVLFGGFMIPRLRMPIWWRWFFWFCPVSWSMYGMFISQYGDYNNLIDTKQTVANFLKSFFGYNKDFLGVVALSVVLFAMFFASLFVISIKYLNFQKR